MRSTAGPVADSTTRFDEAPTVVRARRRPSAVRWASAEAPVRGNEGRARHAASAPALPLLDKVHDFQSAAQVRALGLYPYFRTIASAQDTEVIIAGRKVLMLGSNSYLGLTDHPKIKEAARAAVERYGTSCAGARFLKARCKFTSSSWRPWRTS